MELRFSLWVLEVGESTTNKYEGWGNCSSFFEQSGDDKIVHIGLMGPIYRFYGRVGHSTLPFFGLQHISGDDVVGSAAWALDGDVVGVVEEYVGFFAPAAEDGEDSI